MGKYLNMVKHGSNNNKIVSTREYKNKCCHWWFGRCQTHRPIPQRYRERQRQHQRHQG